MPSNLRSSRWEDTLALPLSLFLLDLINGLMLILLALVVFSNSNDAIFVYTFIVVPLYALFNTIIRRYDYGKDLVIRKRIINGLYEAQNALRTNDFDSFDKKIWEIVRPSLKTTKTPFLYASIRLLQRAGNVGLSEIVRPHISDNPVVSREVAGLAKAFTEGSDEDVFIAFGKLYAAYAYVRNPKEYSSYYTKDEADQYFVNMLEACATDVKLGSLGRARRQLGIGLGEIRKIYPPTEGAIPLLIANWLLLKLREIEYSKPNDFGVFRLTRFELMSRTISTANVAYQKQDWILLSNVIKESYDRSIPRLRIFYLIPRILSSN